MRRLLLLAAGAVLTAVAGCAAPYDDDGEVGGAAPPPAVPAAADAVPVVVDTDLGGDDLVALTFLLRHPAVEVEAVTVAATGLVGCDAGVRVVVGLFHALQETPTPVACGRASAGPGGARFPAAWREAAEAGSGIRPMDATPVKRAAP